MAKAPPLEVVVKMEGLDQFKATLTEAQRAAWLEGMNHVLTWLALQRFSEVMGKDNPYGRGVSDSFPSTGFPPNPHRKDKVG